MLQNLGGVHLLVIVFIVLLLFGAPKLPGLAKSLGQSARILRKEVSSDNSGNADGGTAAAAADVAPTVAADTTAQTATTDQPTAQEPRTDVR